MEDYWNLDKVYNRARLVCDPVDYKMRQQNLLNAIAQYLLDRDKPIDEDGHSKEEI